MSTAISFFATKRDELALFKYLKERADIHIFPWQKMNMKKPILWDMSELPRLGPKMKLGILDSNLGPISFIKRKPRKLSPYGAVSFMSNVLNCDIMQPSPGEGIVDWNKTPALFWSRCTYSKKKVLKAGDIGSQAESMGRVSKEYQSWVNRVMSWIKRNSEKVIHRGKLTSKSRGLQIEINYQVMSPFYAMPDALRFFREGGKGSA